MSADFPEIFSNATSAIVFDASNKDAIVEDEQGNVTRWNSVILKIPAWSKYSQMCLEFEKAKIALQIIQDRDDYWGNRGWIHWFRKMFLRFTRYLC